MSRCRSASAMTATLRLSTTVLLPIARRFQPQLVLVSAGYDAHWNDPLAGMHLSIIGYAALIDRLLVLADELCGGPMVVTLEGGYHLDVLAHAVLNTIRQLSAAEAGIIDPLGPCPWLESDPSKALAKVRETHGL